MKYKIILIVLSAFFLLSFFLLTLAAKHDLTQQIDFDTTVKIQDRMPEKLKPYLIRIVELGSWQILSVIVFLSMLIQRKNAWKIALLFIVIAAVELYGKSALQHPPPPQFMLLRFEHLNIPKYYVRQDVASYPSGHAARPAFLMMVWIPYLAQSLWGYIKRHTSKQPTEFKLNLPFGFILSRENKTSFEIIDFGRIALFLAAFTFLTTFTFLIGFTKIYLGEHWLSDVIGGWLLGAGLGLLTHISFKTDILDRLFAKRGLPR